jgi:sulfite reductase alpha subunit-like flavoprotein
VDFLRNDGANQKLACNMNAGGITIPEGHEKP